LDISFICWFWVIRVFTALEVDGAGRKWSEETTMFDVHTLLEAFWNMPLRYACFNTKPIF